MEYPYWTELLKDVVPGRVAKPRISGLTMVMDAGIPAAMMRGLFDLAADHIDLWKLGNGTAKVCPVERIQDKVSLCQEYDILAYPGGTSFETAYAQGIWKDYLKAVLASGLKVVEISDGSIYLPLRTRRDVIHYAHQLGLMVLTEVGKNREKSPASVSDELHLIKSDLNSGADYVVVEAPESDCGIGVYNGDGSIQEQDVELLVDGLGPLATRVMWDAPVRAQQVYHIRKHGHKVNLGNVHPWDIGSLESMRRGLSAETMATQPTIQQVNEEAESLDKPDDGAESRPTLWVDPSKRNKDKGRQSKGDL